MVVVQRTLWYWLRIVYTIMKCLRKFYLHATCRNTCKFKRFSFYIYRFLHFNARKFDLQIISVLTEITLLFCVNLLLADNYYLCKQMTKMFGGCFVVYAKFYVIIVMTDPDFNNEVDELVVGG